MSESAWLAVVVIAAWLGYVFGWLQGKDGK